MHILSFATMLYLKVLSCVVVCFGLVQTKCIESILLEKVLESNMSVNQKLEEINKIVLAGRNRKDNADVAAVTERIILSDSSVVPPTTQLPLPDIPTSAQWNPWAFLENSKQYPDRPTPPSVSWNPWSNTGENWESQQYPQSSWNPPIQERRQFNSYGNPFQSPPIIYNPNSKNDDSLSLSNLQNQMYSGARYKPYYNAPYASGSYSNYPGSRSYQHQESNPQTAENPVKYNMLQNSINRLPYS